MAEVPERLLRRNRDVDPHFSPDERLFRRIAPRDAPDGNLNESLLPSPDFSVNRSKYSEPDDVLLGWPAFGIFSFRVDDIPIEVVAADGRRFRFGAEHAPEDLNYSHSEVCTYSSGSRMKEKKPPGQVRTQFRLELFARGRVLRRPD